MKLLLFRLILFFCFIFIVSGKSKVYCSEQRIFNVTQNADDQIKLTDIRICPWKYGASMCVNFSFDDNNLSHNKISRILDIYGFKGTFFVITNLMYVDSLKNIIKRGHEVGSHSVNHPNFSILDSINIDYQLRRSKYVIDSTFGIKCISFAEPGHQRSDLSTRLTFMNYLFIRNYSEYSSIKRTLFSYSLLSNGTLTIDDLMTEMKMSIKNHTMLLLAGHGLDDEGYVPTSQPLLTQTMDSVKKYVDKGDIWETTIKEGGHYESLYHELILDKIQKGDTLILKFNNYNSLKYKSMDSSKISVEVPKVISQNIKILSSGVNFSESDEKYFFTIDLKKNLEIDLKIKGLQIYTDSIIEKAGDNLYLFSNPNKDELMFYCPGVIQYSSIYDIMGRLIKKIMGDINQIDLKQFENGVYILKTFSKIGTKVKEYSKNFIKY